jgi:aspartate aminotransferase
MPTLPVHAESVPLSGVRQVMDAAWQLPDSIGLHVGEPSFATPEHVLAAASSALSARETRYSPNGGIPQLRAAIAEKLLRHNGLTVPMNRIAVTAGGMQALHLAMSAMLHTGDEVLIPDPGWPNFEMAATLVQATPVHYPLRAEHGFLPEVAELEALITPRTRAILINSPSNPIGPVLTEDLAEKLCRFADEHDLWVISDECYDQLTFDVPHVSLGRFDTAHRVFGCFSFSKTYAMTGLRVGYLAAPDDTTAATLTKLQETVVSCVNTPAQFAALAALTGPQDIVETMRLAYRDRRDAAVEFLDRHGVGYLRPQGAFYLWIDVRDRCGGDVRSWTMDRLRRHGVAVGPGDAFGPSGQGWVRVSLATETEALLEGLRRLVA